MKAVLLILLILHGLIHLPGFVKALNPDSVKQLTQSISKTHGILWLVASLLFVASALLIFLSYNRGVRKLEIPQHI